MRRPGLQFWNALMEHQSIISILLALLILATCYSIITPIFEAPDEPAHYFYIKHIADTGALPVITDTTTVEPWAWEGFTILGVLISHLVIYPLVQGAAWGGGLEWGPRYLIPIVPLLALPLQQLLRWRWGRLCFFALLVPSVVIQIVASTANWGIYWQWLVQTFPGEGGFYLENGLLLDPRNR